MAEARSAVNTIVYTDAHNYRIDPYKHTLQVSLQEQGLSIFIPRPKYIVRGCVRTLYRFRNKLVNLLWPFGPILTSLLAAVFSAYVLQCDGEHWLRSGQLADYIWTYDSLFPWTSQWSLEMRVCYLSFLTFACFLLFVLAIQRLLLRLLLQYKGWMNEKNVSTLTKIWGLTIKVCYLWGRRPLLYSFQGSLPTLPIPDLKDTCRRYLESVKAILPPDEYEKVAKAAGNFELQEGAKLQSKLKLHYWTTTNYVSDWWERFVYLSPRSSILINSNYYGLDYLSGIPSQNQFARAANLSHQLLHIRRLLDREELSPMLMRDTVPICMNQYRRAFSTNRNPGREADTLVHYDSGDARHIAVLFQGIWYCITATDNHNEIVSAYELQQQFLVIQKDAQDPSKSRPSDSELALPALTTMNRTDWATARDQYFGHGLNKQSLSLIERAAFVLILDDKTPVDRHDLAKSSLCGTGTNRWCDKSFNLLVYANGQAAVHGEHAWADAPALGHIWEMALARELDSDMYDPNGCIKAPLPKQSSVWRSLLQGSPSIIEQPKRLAWAIPLSIEGVLTKAVQEASLAIQDLNLQVLVYDTYGKKLMKNAKISPDAYVQMALQVAFFRDQKKIGLTYESAMTRAFNEGRTETIRTVSLESKKFVETFLDPKATPDEKKRALFLAGEKHQVTSRNAGFGAGIDRHLFALFVVAKGTGTESKFLESYGAMKWTLSTSQLPQNQGTVTKRKLTDPCWLKVSGGFGPVDDNGYGVCYMIADDSHLFFHVSSKHSCNKTDAVRFSKTIASTLDDMKLLFDTPKKTN